MMRGDDVNWFAHNDLNDARLSELHGARRDTCRCTLGPITAGTVPIHAAGRVMEPGVFSVEPDGTVTMLAPDRGAWSAGPQDGDDTIRADGAEATMRAAKAASEAIGRIPADKPLWHYEFDHDDDCWPPAVIDLMERDGVYVPADCPGPELFGGQMAAGLAEAARRATEGIYQMVDAINGGIETTGKVVK